MQCGTCGQHMAKGVRDYPQREQLDQHMWVRHRLNAYIVNGRRRRYVRFIPEASKEELVEAAKAMVDRFLHETDQAVNEMPLEASTEMWEALNALRDAIAAVEGA